MFAKQRLVIEHGFKILCLQIPCGARHIGRGDHADQLFIAKGRNYTGAALRCLVVIAQRIGKCAIERHRQRDFAIKQAWESNIQCSGHRPARPLCVRLRHQTLVPPTSFTPILPCSLIPCFAVQFLLMTTSRLSKPPHLRAALRSKTSNPITLCIDIGGSGLKAMLLDAKGHPVSERQRVVTPAIPTPRAVLQGPGRVARPMPAQLRSRLGRISRRGEEGVTYTAANLHPLWYGFPLEKELAKRWKKPVRVANDASVQGYGAIKGDGVELAAHARHRPRLFAVYRRHALCPGLELGHHPWKREREYEDYLGRRGLDKYGKKHWNKLLQEAIEQTAKLFNWDHLYLGGGNTKKIDFKPGKNIEIVSNEAGLLGGVALWREWE